MNRDTSAMKTGFVLAIFPLLFGCVQNPEKVVDPQIEFQNTQIEFQYDQIEFQYTQMELQYDQIEYQKNQIERINAKLNKSRLSNSSLDKVNKALRSRNSWLIKTNSSLKNYNQELAMKIDMLQTLDHQVEEKRQTYISD